MRQATSPAYLAQEGFRLPRTRTAGPTKPILPGEARELRIPQLDASDAGITVGACVESGIHHPAAAPRLDGVDDASAPTSYEGEAA